MLSHNSEVRLSLVLPTTDWPSRRQNSIFVVPYSNMLAEFDRKSTRVRQRWAYTTASNQRAGYRKSEFLRSGRAGIDRDGPTWAVGRRGSSQSYQIGHLATKFRKRATPAMALCSPLPRCGPLARAAWRAAPPTRAAGRPRGRLGTGRARGRRATGSHRPRGPQSCACTRVL